MSPLLRSRGVFIALFLLGLSVRIVFLPLPGTGDVTVFKIWAHAGATGRVSDMYGVGGTPPERRLHDFDGRQATVNYPPIALYELALVGLAYDIFVPGFPNGRALTAAVKVLPVLAEVAIVWLLVLAVRRFRPGGPEKARFAGLAYWFNPATLLASAVLGYIDALFALPALGALVAAAAGRGALSGGLLALAVLTKPQAFFVAPVVGLAFLIGHEPRNPLPTIRKLALAAGAGALTAGLVLAPVVVAGAWPNFLQAMGSFARHDMLSGQAANIWWIVTYAMRAVYAVPEMGVADAFLSPVRRPLAISTVVQLGYPNPRLGATAVMMGAVVWGLWKARNVRDLPRLALTGAWIVYAYFMISVQVHENHFFMILPLLALTAAALPQWRKMFWVLSTIFALNLYLFYGLGDGVGFYVPRTATGIDATVWLSAANVVAFYWFGRQFGRCLDAPEPVSGSGLTSSLRGEKGPPRAGQDTGPTAVPGDIPRPRESSSR